VPEACSSQSVPAEASRRCVWSRGRRFAASSVPGSMAADYPRHPHASDRTTPRPWLGPALAIEHASISVALPADKRDASTSYHSWFLGVLACLPSRSHLASCWRCERGQAASVPGGLTNRPALAPAPLPPALRRDDVYSVTDYHQLP
jgi:hypothetical protein